MKLTPLDLTRKEFSVSFRGYNRAEVDEFLSSLASDYETLFRENASLKGEISSLAGKLEEYRSMEENLKNSLLLAQKVAEEVKNNSQKEAEIILNQARIKAEKALEEASRKLEETRFLYQRVRAELRSLIRTFSEILDRTEGQGGGEASP